MKSMTAYAQVPLAIKSRRFRLEIQSLNKRGLDIQTDLPPSFLSLNIPLRLYLAGKIERGSILVRLKEEASEKTLLNDQEISQVKTRLVELAKVAGYSSDEVSFKLVLDKASSLQAQEIEMDEIEPFLKTCIDQLITMRTGEGERLKQDFKNRFELISHTLKQIEDAQKEAPAKVKHKLLERLKHLELAGHDEERLLKEVIYYVEKQDVTEEITRLKSHMIQMHELLNSKEAVGRKFEFLTQECFREVNTLSAKTSELAAINLTLILKTEFEKIKEQVMNIE